MNAHTGEPDTALHSGILHYYLDFMQKGEHNFYIWRHHPSEGPRHQAALLVNLNNIYIPQGELDKLVFSFEDPHSSILSVAFTHCHIHNQQELKRKLKAHNVRLFSQSAFFADLLQAQQWLAAQLR